MKRGIRNNNPLNIRRSATRWQGAREEQKDKSFVQFKSMAYGYRAAWKVLQSYYERFCLQGQTFTVRNIISRWAPPTENNTDKYITDVCNLSGLTPNTRIGLSSKNAIKKMVYAMSIIENGNTDATRAAGLPDMDIIEQGYNLL